MSLKNGHVYTLLGKNGAGKTTFINILLRLIKEDSGSVVSNVSVKKRSWCSLSGRLISKRDNSFGFDKATSFIFP